MNQNTAAETSSSFCRRCGSELTPAASAEGFCLVCGEPIPKAGPAASAEPAAESAAEAAGPERISWTVDGEFVVCPICQASYFADPVPDTCERCAAEPQFASTRWELPAAAGSQTLLLRHRASGQQIVPADGLQLGRSYTECLKDDRYVSRLHATVLVQDGSVSVRDEGSSNGTSVNGERLKPHKARLLKPGDTLKLDEQVFDVCPPSGEKRA